MLKISRVSLVVLATSLLQAVLLPALLAAAPPKEAGKIVDAGTFSILVDGKRVGVETFKIQDLGATNATSSQIKITGGSNKAEQSSVLTMNSAGELVRYVWKELSPGKAETTVEVTEKAVMQHITMANVKKPVDIPYMTSASTMVLDDNVFAHRQLLVWRFLRSSCGQKDGKQSCTPGKLGVLVPAQHVVAVVSVDFAGSEKLQYKGAERDVAHLKLTSDDLEWNIWVDPADSYKILRITIPANKTEVLRD
ncbi:MAG: hypothetical protein M3P27_12825 [Acidobacteriota bacterium]|nr:hypothetical protein [Acidobacteriota bacterium]